LLNRDHRIITHLTKYGAKHRAGDVGLEHLILKLDARLTMAICCIARSNYRSEALKALRGHERRGIPGRIAGVKYQAPSTASRIA
jgi:hypothetical protein